MGRRRLHRTKTELLEQQRQRSKRYYRRHKERLNAESMRKYWKKKVCGIYQIINKTNGKRYIGSSCNIFSRWWRHKNDLNKNKHHSKSLQRAWNKYGENNFEFGIVETCNLSQLFPKERTWLNTVREDKCNFYNISFEADCPNRGRPLSISHKEKISMALKGRIFSAEHIKNLSGINNHNFGTHLSVDKREKLRNINSGKYISPETRQKISNSLKGKFTGNKNPMFGRNGHLNPMFGKRHSKQVKETIRRKRIERGSYEIDHTIYNFIHPTYGTETCSQYILGKKYNLDRSNLNKVIKSKQKSINKWTILQ